MPALAHGFRSLIGLLSALSVAVGCAAAAPPPARPVARPAPGPASGFLEGKPGRLRSHVLDFAIELPLPDKSDWQVQEGPSWLVAEHRPSSSQLALRTWRADRLVRRAECEAQARLVRPTIPVLRDETVVDRQPFSAPVDSDNELIVGVEPGAAGITGYALVFGASIGRCYAAIFTTSARGQAPEVEVAARLGRVVDRVLSRVRVRSVDERAPRRHLILSPKSASE